MKKLILVVTLIFTLMGITRPVHAEDATPYIEVNVKINGGGYVQIDSESVLPEKTVIKDSGKYYIEYPNAEPGDKYTYTIKQINMDNSKVSYDKSVYYLDVYIYINEDTEAKYAVAVLRLEGESEKPFEVSFTNKDKPTYVVPYTGVNFYNEQVKESSTLPYVIGGSIAVLLFIVVLAKRREAKHEA